MAGKFAFTKAQRSQRINENEIGRKVVDAAIAMCIELNAIQA